MADKGFAKEAAEVYAQELRDQCLKAGLHRAAAAVRIEPKGEGYRVWIPHEVVPYAFVWDRGLRHPLNYKNQVEAKHAKSWMRHMGPTPKKKSRNGFLRKTRNSTSAAEKALDKGMKKTMEEWERTF